MQATCRAVSKNDYSLFGSTRAPVSLRLSARRIPGYKRRPPLARCSFFISQQPKPLQPLKRIDDLSDLTMVEAGSDVYDELWNGIKYLQREQEEIQKIVPKALAEKYDRVLDCFITFVNEELYPVLYMVEEESPDSTDKTSTPVEQTPVEQTPVEQTSVEPTPVEPTPVEPPVDTHILELFAQSESSPEPPLHFPAKRPPREIEPTPDDETLKEIGEEADFITTKMNQVASIVAEVKDKSVGIKRKSNHTRGLFADGLRRKCVKCDFSTCYRPVVSKHKKDCPNAKFEIVR